jgi:Family of unknown function (DUF6629)
VCFSPEGDLAAGVVVVAIGIDALRHVRGRTEYLAIAALPVALGLHQLDETLVWWSLQGHLPRGLGHVAMWAYLVFALVALPVLAPLLMTLIEPSARHRRRILPLVALGTAVSVVLLEAMLAGHPDVRLARFHLAYTIGLQHGVAVIGLYVVATCGPMLLSSMRPFVWFGVANLAAVVALALLCADGFASLWCFYAAVLSGAIVLHLRRHGPHDAATSVAAVSSEST